MVGLSFPNYTQIPSRLPLRWWQAIRSGSIVAALAIAALLIATPDTGLFVMWKVVIPLLPVMFLVAPGIWRNICPLAASNQTPRALSITKALTAPAWLKEYGYVIAFSLFIGFVVLRRLGLDDSGPLSALLLLGAMTAAFTGGMFLKGKSGWCSTICPLLPVQRIYGQTPLLMVANAHCQPCVGCVKNCYDFNPKAAYLADLNDADDYWSGYRRYFVGAFPGLIVGFFVVPDGPALDVLGWMAVCVAAGVASFATLIAFWKTSAHTITSLYGAVAFSLFYWFARRDPPGAADLGRPRRRDRAGDDLVRAHAAARRSRSWSARPHPPPPPRARSSAAAPARSPAAPSNAPEITFVPDNKRVAPKPGPDAAGGRRGRRDDDRGRLPDGRLRRRPGRDQVRPGVHLAGQRRRAGDAQPARLRAQHAHGVLREDHRPGRGRADARQGRDAGAQPRLGLQLRQVGRAGSS